MSDLRTRTYPIGAQVTVDALDADPHPLHHRLREHEPVSWLPCLDGWLVTSHALALEAVRDASTFTVDDPRFTTARVIGPSMLSLDAEAHGRHRAPFVAPFRAAQVRERFAEVATEHARTLLDALRGDGHGELRRGFAGPMAAGIVARALGMTDEDTVDEVLAAYDAIVASVTGMSAGDAPTQEGVDAFSRLRERLQPVIDGRRGDSLLAAAARAPGDGGDALGDDEIAANAAVLLFGGIETTEGMIANALVAILTATEGGEDGRAGSDPAWLDTAIEESLRLEPAAAVIDRYATRDVRLGDAEIARGDLVRISIAAANRDPSIFEDPDRFVADRPNARRHLAFAQGPHVCVGVHLARLEARAALTELLALPDLRLDPAAPPRTRGLVFRKPQRLDARWTATATRP